MISVVSNNFIIVCHEDSCAAPSLFDTPPSCQAGPILSMEAVLVSVHDNLLYPVT